VPAILEAGRVTAGDVHRARVGDRGLPVGETESARDTTFGYQASNLYGFVAERAAAPSPPPPCTALASKPAWVVARGGITSHDTAVRGLEIRGVEVIGQLLPGLVSVLRPANPSET